MPPAPSAHPLSPGPQSPPRHHDPSPTSPEHGCASYPGDAVLTPPLPELGLQAFMKRDGEGCSVVVIVAAAEMMYNVFLLFLYTAMYRKTLPSGFRLTR